MGREGEKHQCVRYMDLLFLAYPHLDPWPVTHVCAMTGN